MSVLQVTVWNDNNENGLTVEHQFELSNTVLSISCHSQLVAIGSTRIQLYDTETLELIRTLVESKCREESVEVIR